MLHRGDFCINPHTKLLQTILYRFFTKKTISMTTLYLPSQNPPQSPFPDKIIRGQVSKGGGLKFPSLKKRGQGRFSDKCHLTYELISNCKKTLLHNFKFVLFIQFGVGVKGF